MLHQKFTSPSPNATTLSKAERRQVIANAAREFAAIADTLSARDLVNLMNEHREADPHGDPGGFFTFHQARLILGRLSRAAGR